MIAGLGYTETETEAIPPAVIIKGMASDHPSEHGFTLATCASFSFHAGQGISLLLFPAPNIYRLNAAESRI
jgi:hypothetical protein